MNILGLSYMYHDSAACLLQDGAVVAAAAEERFIRIKHSIDFPLRALKYCLAEGGLSVGDLDGIVFYEKPFLKFERILKTHLMAFPRSYASFRAFLPMWLNYKLSVPQTIREETGYPGPVYFTDHHYAHAASAFLPSPFERAIILTMDGTGEWSTTSHGVGEGTDIRLDQHQTFPHSLGLLYSAVTAHLGFKVNGGEGKVMGLASYGKPSFRRKFDQAVRIREDGSFQLNLDYFSFHYDLVMTNRKFAEHFCPPRAPESDILPEHQDLAASLQSVVEDAILAMVRSLVARHGIDRLCIAGGVGLNCVANGLILEDTPVRELFVQPAAGDDGASLGAALYLDTLLGGGRDAVEAGGRASRSPSGGALAGRDRWRMRDAYLGPSFSDAEIEAFLRRSKWSYRELTEDDLPARAAELLSRGRIVGWFQGRMEFGPRALGNRSILADPRDPKMKDILNRRVKHREPFRPFAPAVCVEDAPEYFATSHESPFMLLSVPVREDKRGLIPSVVHVDGSARLQTVSARSNPLFHRLIKEFGRRTGVPVVLNTSFNVRGEPIVCTPQDAVSSFLRTEMDDLLLHRFHLAKEDNR